MIRSERESTCSRPSDTIEHMDSQPNNDGQFAARWVLAQRTVSAFIVGSIPNFQDAEDVLQAVAVKAFEMRDRYDPAACRFSTWVIGIARNEIRHWYRSAQRDRHVFGEDVFDALVEAAEDIDADVRDVQEALAECLRDVTGRGRKILEMRYHESLRSRDIAERLDTSESTVNVTLFRVRAALLRCIVDKTGIEGVSP